MNRPTSPLREDLAFCAGPAPAQVAAGSTTVVRQSGVAIPVTLAPPGSAVSHSWTGKATRERTIFKVNIYPFVLRIGMRMWPEENSLPSTENRQRRWTIRSIDTFYRRLLEMHIPMTMRLVMTRDISGESIANASDDAPDPATVGLRARYESRLRSRPGLIEERASPLRHTRRQSEGVLEARHSQFPDLASVAGTRNRTMQDQNADSPVFWSWQFYKCLSKVSKRQRQSSDRQSLQSRSAHRDNSSVSCDLLPLPEIPSVPTILPI